MRFLKIMVIVSEPARGDLYLRTRLLFDIDMISLLIIMYYVLFYAHLRKQIRDRRDIDAT